MPSFGASLDDLVIENGASASNALTSHAHYGDAIGIAIATPADFVETGVIEASFDNGTNWVDVEVGNDQSLLSVPAAGQCRVYFELGVLPQFRIATTVPVAGERTFKAYKLWDSER